MGGGTVTLETPPALLPIGSCSTYPPHTHPQDKRFVFHLELFLLRVAYTSPPPSIHSIMQTHTRAQATRSTKRMQSRGRCSEPENWKAKMKTKNKHGNNQEQKPRSFKQTQTLTEKTEKLSNNKLASVFLIVPHPCSEFNRRKKKKRKISTKCWVRSGRICSVLTGNERRGRKGEAWWVYSLVSAFS